MSFSTLEYRFDALKTFARTLLSSDWSQVTLDIAEDHTTQLTAIYTQFLVEAQKIEYRSKLVAEAQRIHLQTQRLIDEKMSSSDLEYFGDTTTHLRIEPLSHEPTIEPFAGEFREWCRFLERFNKCIFSDKKYSDEEKLHILRHSLRGKAAQLVERARNCEAALHTLRNAYGNKFLIVESHLDYFREQPKVDRLTIRSLMNEIAQMKADFEKMKLPNALDYQIMREVKLRLCGPLLAAWNQKRDPIKTEMPSLLDMEMFLKEQMNNGSDGVNYLRFNWSGSPPTNESTSYELYSPFSPKREMRSAAAMPAMPTTPIYCKPFMKNTSCCLCNHTVEQADRIECAHCPTLAHFVCLKNAESIRYKKQTRGWTCKKCLRCALCRSTSRVVSVHVVDLSFSTIAVFLKCPFVFLRFHSS